jgi:hypothetical protein
MLNIEESYTAWNNVLHHECQKLIKRGYKTCKRLAHKGHNNTPKIILLNCEPSVNSRHILSCLNEMNASKSLRVTC